VGRTTIYEKQ